MVDRPSQSHASGSPGIPDVIQADNSPWPMANLDYENTRATTNSKINSQTVKSLETAWKFSLPGTGYLGNMASNPLIVDGTVYLQDLASNLFAVDLANGKEKWRKLYDAAVVGPNGPTIGYGKVFAQVGADDLVAVDINNGQEVWTLKLPGPAGSQAPYVYDNLVFTGVAAGAAIDQPKETMITFRGYAGGTSGHVVAVDQSSGKIAWQFQTVEKGFWGNPKLNSGAGIWYPPAIDTNTGMTFWGTGNPAPFPGTKDFPNGSSRPGDNLYSCSILAIDHQSGKLKWYQQLKKHDLFDNDAQISPVLAKAKINGKEREIVIGGGKLGEVAAIDRESGEIYWRVKVGKHMNDHMQELPPNQLVEVYPGPYGGVETPMALTNGVLYVPVVNLPLKFSANGYDAKNGVEALAGANSYLNLNQGDCEMVAIDITSGNILWDHHFDSVGFGGATVVNDLVFTSLFDGTVYALSTKDGSEVWSTKLPGGINGWPAVADDMILFPVGITGHPALVALKINQQAAKTGGQPAQPAKAQAGNKSQEEQKIIDQGKKLYLAHGARGHQPNGEGVDAIIPKLADSQFVSGDPDAVIEMVLFGEGAMPAWDKILTDEDIAAVVSYIRNAWGNQASIVTVDQVKQVRKNHQQKKQGL